MTMWTNYISALLRFVLLLIHTPISNSSFASSSSPINLYVMNSILEGKTYGKFCYDPTQYKPTCGWKVIVSMNYKITKIRVIYSTKRKVDDYTYELTGESFLDNLTDKLGECQDIDIEGGFGYSSPVISVTYSCVCLAHTNGLCQPVEHTLVPVLGLTTTTPPTTEQPTVSSVVSNNIIKLGKENDNCYTGLSKERLAFSVRHLTGCGFFCLEDVTCEGINYHSSSK